MAGRSSRRANRADTVRLWHKITTVEDAKWTEAYHDQDPNKKMSKSLGNEHCIYLDDDIVTLTEKIMKAPTTTE